MKTKNFLIMVGLVVLGGIVKVSGQNGNTNNNYSAGNQSGTYISTGQDNTAVGERSMFYIPGFTPLITGNYNTALGKFSLSTVTSGSDNVAIGGQSMFSMSTGSSNVCVGRSAGFSIGTGNCNTLIGANCGTNVNGNANTLLGKVAASAVISNTIILADGGTVSTFGTQRVYISSNGNVGFSTGDNIPALNRLEIVAATGTPGLVAGTAGLRFRGYNNTSASITNTTNKVLSLNSTGDVILVNDVTAAGITNTCGTKGYIPTVIDGSGNLACSQIYDNGSTSGVGIGLTNPSTNNWTYSGVQVGQIGPTVLGTLKLDINGTTRGVAFYATSDKKFKKDIKSIESPLETIQKIDGKTYLWNKEANKEMNFDSGLHSGFIAQELEKVLPHLVATDDKGNKAVNYMELMPYLVEAIKEQQTQINDLKAQISDNFKAQNQDLISFTNTKIISVSPNPSRDVIAVSLNIEKGVENASLQVFDLNGKMLSNLSIKERETNINKTLQKDNFGQGIYIVSLVVNGKSIDSKKIIFN